MTHDETIAQAVASIRAPSQTAREGAEEIQRHLTKPAGALGRLEELHVWAAGVRRESAPAPGRTMIVVAAADHGVADEGVSAYPQAVTAAMVRNFLDGGAAINVLARQARADLAIVDCGVAGDIDDARLVVAKRGGGTGNIARGPAMTRDDAAALVAGGITFVSGGAQADLTACGIGDMGIGNTTSAAAITAVLADASPRATAGRGTGIDDVVLARKVAVIERALAINAPDRGDALDVLAKIGGCETAFLAGVIVGCAARALPVVLDGYPTTAAALIAASLAPAAKDYMLASHASAEPGHRIALEHLGSRPLLGLDMRLGEGTGAALALMLLESALRIPREMATFDAAGVPRQQDAIARPN